MGRICLIVILAARVFLASPAAEAASLGEKIDNALAFSQIQLDHLAQRRGPDRFRIPQASGAVRGCRTGAVGSLPGSCG